MQTFDWLKGLDIISRVLAPIVALVLGLVGYIIRGALAELKSLRKDHDLLKAECDKTLIERTYLVAQNNTEHKMIEARIDKNEGATSGLDAKLDKIGLQLALLQQTVDMNKK